MALEGLSCLDGASYLRGAPLGILWRRCLQPHPSHEAARGVVGILLIADRIEGAGVALQGVERVDDTGVAHGRIHALGLHSCQLPSRMD
jgi:hypothetical protein